MTSGADTAQDLPKAIRPPLGIRIYVAVFLCLWCCGLAVAAVAIARQGSLGALIPILMLAFGLTLGFRLLRLSAGFAHDELVIRNYFQTRHIARQNIEEFRVGGLGASPYRTIYVLTRDGAVVPLDVAARPYRSLHGLASLDKRMAALQGWLAGS